MGKFQGSKELQDKIDDFEKSDITFKSAWSVLEQKMAQELEYLDGLREERNEKLDLAKRALRAEALEASIKDVKFVKIGPFSVQKKWSSFYVPEKLVALLKDKGLYDSAISAKIIAEKIEVEKFDVVKQYLKVEGIEADFEDCEDGMEMTPAVTGPKPIPPFGVEQKDAK